MMASKLRLALALGAVCGAEALATHSGIDSPAAGSAEYEDADEIEGRELGKVRWKKGIKQDVRALKKASSLGGTSSRNIFGGTGEKGEKGEKGEDSALDKTARPA